MESILNTFLNKIMKQMKQKKICTEIEDIQKITKQLVEQHKQLISKLHFKRNPMYAVKL